MAWQTAEQGAALSQGPAYAHTWPSDAHAARIHACVHERCHDRDRGRVKGCMHSYAAAAQPAGTAALACCARCTLAVWLAGRPHACMAAWLHADHSAPHGHAAWHAGGAARPLRAAAGGSSRARNRGGVQVSERVELQRACMHACGRVCVRAYLRAGTVAQSRQALWWRCKAALAP